MTAEESRRGNMTIEIQFAEREIIYDPASDSWDDNSREAVHEQLSMQRLNRWVLTARALEEMGEQ